MKIAVEGCAHGELDVIYECLEALEAKENIKIDLLICCGDFQSVRNKDDLQAMAVPDKYKNICSFYKYYSGEKKAPVLTLFVGGNHEASNYLQELPFGGWVAPNIYYLGRAGVIRIGNLRIGGMSGIFNGRDYLQGLWESPPYTQNSLRSVYHVRSIDVFRLSQLREKVHIMLSHDWPRGITDYGDREGLLRRKPFFRDDIESNQLGSAPAEKLLHELKPDYWFAAHLHCQFAAIVEHKGETDSTETKFLALDKCLPKRRFLQVLDTPAELDGDKCLKHDCEWLAVLKNTNHLLTVRNTDCHMPGPGGDERYDFTPTEQEKQTIRDLMGDLEIKQESFIMTAPAYDVNSPRGVQKDPILNPQTVFMCEKLGIDDPLQVVMARAGRTMRQPEASVPQPSEPIEKIEHLQTPSKSFSLSLPPPVTPSTEAVEDSLEESISTSTDCTSILSDSVTTDNTVTTPKGPGKKTFKRRNQAIYNEVSSESSEISNSLDDVKTKKKELPA